MKKFDSFNVIENFCSSNILPITSLLQEDVPEFVEDDEIEESDISDMEVISEHIFSNAILLSFFHLVQ